MSMFTFGTFGSACMVWWHVAIRLQIESKHVGQIWWQMQKKTQTNICHIESQELLCPFLATEEARCCNMTDSVKINSYYMVTTHIFR